MIICGDCLDAMRGMELKSVDAIVTDPPYGLEFMGKEWDHGIPGVPFWTESLRVAKPGCHLLAFGGTRTFHRLACAIEDAGWEIRDNIGYLHGPLLWGFGSGFPKSHDVSKAIDKAAGKEREVVGPGQYHCEGRTKAMGTNGIYGGPPKDMVGDGKWETAPATDAARQWEGWGTALKPAYEPIILARKPLEGTVAENVQKWGTGAINIDGCRVAWAFDGERDVADRATFGSNGYSGGLGKHGGKPVEAGRWPANICHDGSDEVLELFPQSKSTGGIPDNIGAFGKGGIYGKANGRMTTNAGGLGDSGSAARFFYCAKASRREREMGCEGMEEKIKPGVFDDDNYEWKKNGGHVQASPTKNHHPTVKPLALMRYLCRLVTPPNGVILDPFMGSGTTGMAAKMEGFQFIGIEKDAEYCEIAKRRIEATA